MEMELSTGQVTVTLTEKDILNAIFKDGIISEELDLIDHKIKKMRVKNLEDESLLIVELEPPK